MDDALSPGCAAARIICKHAAAHTTFHNANLQPVCRLENPCEFYYFSLPNLYFGGFLHSCGASSIPRHQRSTLHIICTVWADRLKRIHKLWCILSNTLDKTDSKRKWAQGIIFICLCLMQGSVRCLPPPTLFFFVCQSTRELYFRLTVLFSPSACLYCIIKCYFEQGFSSRICIVAKFLLPINTLMLRSSPLLWVCPAAAAQLQIMQRNECEHYRTAWLCNKLHIWWAILFHFAGMIYSGPVSLILLVRICCPKLSTSVSCHDVDGCSVKKEWTVFAKGEAVTSALHSLLMLFETHKENAREGA